jgi:hypothetical protein
MNKKMDDSYYDELKLDRLIESDGLFGAYDNIRECIEDLEEALKNEKNVPDLLKIQIVNEMGKQVLNMKMKVTLNDKKKYLVFPFPEE